MSGLLLCAPVVLGVLIAVAIVRLTRRARPASRRAVARLALALAGGIAGALAWVLIVGSCLPRRHASTRSARFEAAPEVLWKVIADFQNHVAWRPGLRSVQRLTDRSDHPVWLEVGGYGPGVPPEMEVFELEISAFLLWLRAPAAGSLLEAEARIKELELEVEILEPPHRMRTRILDDDIPFGGTWTWELASENGGCRVRITEEGFIDAPSFRYFARARGHAETIERYLEALALRLGERVAIDA